MKMKNATLIEIGLVVVVVLSLFLAGFAAGWMYGIDDICDKLGAVKTTVDGEDIYLTKADIANGSFGALHEALRKKASNK